MRASSLVDRKAALKADCSEQKKAGHSAASSVEWKVALMVALLVVRLGPLRAGLWVEQSVELWVALTADYLALKKGEHLAGHWAA